MWVENILMFQIDVALDRNRISRANLALSLHFSQNMRVEYNFGHILVCKGLIRITCMKESDCKNYSRKLLLDYALLVAEMIG